MSIRSLRPRSNGPWRRACAAVGVFVMTLAPLPAAAQSKPGAVVFFAGLGPELIQYDVDVKRAKLTKRGSVMLPANVQEGHLMALHAICRAFDAEVSRRRAAEATAGATSAGPGRKASPRSTDRRRH